MHVTYSYLLSLLVCNFMLCQETEQKNIPFELPPEIEIEKERFEKRTLEQAMHITNSQEPCKCLKYTGKEFVSCMDYATKEEVRQTFAKMSLYARIKYLEKMDLLEYRRFLAAFENEDQWKETIYALPEHEQSHLPQTLREQLIIIRDTWAECSEQKFGKYEQVEKDPETKDLAAWRNKTLNGFEKQTPFTSDFLKWLHARFFEKKVALFNKNEQQK
ncbi:MAG: hypothetical protein WD055_03105 [Candidatus Dependentiae bacterium]